MGFSFPAIMTILNRAGPIKATSYPHQKSGINFWTLHESVLFSSHFNINAQRNKAWKSSPNFLVFFRSLDVRNWFRTQTNPKSRKDFAERRETTNSRFKSQAETQGSFKKEKSARIPCLHDRFNCPDRYLEFQRIHHEPQPWTKTPLAATRSEELLPQITAGHYLGLSFLALPGGKRFESHFWFTEKYADMLLKMATERIFPKIAVWVVDTWKRMENSRWMQS